MIEIKNNNKSCTYYVWPLGFHESPKEVCFTASAHESDEYVKEKCFSKAKARAQELAKFTKKRITVILDEIAVCKALEPEFEWEDFRSDARI